MRLALEMSQVRTVIDSYHGRLDAVAEALQNAVDAVEQRWADWEFDENTDLDEPDELPRIRVYIDYDANSIGVLDNGIGIDPITLPDVLEPFVSPKRLSQNATRGHKGVGTTFLAYGHPRFEVHTRVQGSEPVAYAIEWGRKWAMSRSVSEPPEYKRIEVTPSLEHLTSGTYVKVFFDAATTLRSVSKLLHNSPEMWREVLRSGTALGQVTLSTAQTDRPEWAKHIRATIHHPDSTVPSPFYFPFPHVDMQDGTHRELQWLQNHPGSHREYELIYVERSHPQLMALLKDELDELENSEDEYDREIASLLEEYEISVYASLSYKNTFYEEQFRDRIGRPNAQRFSLPYGVGGGIMVASVGMPMGALQSHLMETMQPQERRRYFILIHFNDEYSPDAGRKTIPQHVEPVVGFLEERLLKLLRTQNNRLLRDRESGARKKSKGIQGANQELKELISAIDRLEGQDQELDMRDLVLDRAPRWEEEMVALFVNLIIADHLPSYAIRALPGTYGRYDFLFDYQVVPAEAAMNNERLGISRQRLGEEGISLTELWGEFKFDINDLVADLEAEEGDPSKKYFNQISLLVVWAASAVTSDTYSVAPFSQRNWTERTFFGATHMIQAPNNDHCIEVIELRSALARLRDV